MKKEKNKTHNTKYNRGITLIALIITIVVLLILAIVSIGAIKDSNIIKHSQTASSKYTIAQEQEKLQLAVDKWEIAKNVPENAEEEKDLKTIIESSLEKDIKSGEVVKVDGNTDGSLTIIFKSGRQYSITKNGDIKEKNGDEPLSIIGKYGTDENSGVEDWEYYEFLEDGKGRRANYKDGDYDFTYTINNEDNTGIINGMKKFKLIGTSENKILLLGYDDEHELLGTYYANAYTTNGSCGLGKYDSEREFEVYDGVDGTIITGFKLVIHENVAQGLYEGGVEEEYVDYFILDNCIYVRSEGQGWYDGVFHLINGTSVYSY